MIHYHGGPITPESCALRVWKGRHAFVSFAAPQQIEAAAGVSQSFALDNGAFSFWKAGKPTDWSGYMDWVSQWIDHPGCDFAIIPDVIDGSENENDRLIASWPFKKGYSVPVWHMHESLARLRHLALEFPRVAIGTSGEYAQIGTNAWWQRMNIAMSNVCNERSGRPLTKLHGLRMLDPDVFSRFPFHSADSTNVARNIGIDGAWRGTYTPASKETRGQVIAERIEQHNSAERFTCGGVQQEIAA